MFAGDNGAGGGFGFCQVGMGSGGAVSSGFSQGGRGRAFDLNVGY